MAVMDLSLDQAQIGTPPLRRALAFVSRHLLTLAALATSLYLFAPIIIMVILSFNHVEGRFDFVWHSFSIDAWLRRLNPARSVFTARS